MRIATWNMGYWGHARVHERAWHWLLEDLAPDVALVQECVVPDWVRSDATVFFERAYPDSQRQRWGTALVARGVGAAAASLPAVDAWLSALGPDAPVKCSATRLRGWCVAARVSLPAGPPALCMSIHNPAYPIARPLLASTNVDGIKLNLSRDVWLLDVIFHFLKQELTGPLLLGGDFNYSRLLDDPKPRGNAEFFDRIAKEGFVSLHRLFNDADEQTFFHPKRRGHQLDYLYADPSIAARTNQCRVIPRAQVEGYSDHVPVVAELHFA